MAHKEQGFTLLEWLLASSLGGIVCVFQLYTSVHHHCLLLSANFEVTENAHIAFARLAKDIRMAGFMGCTSIAASDEHAYTSSLNTPTRGYTPNDIHPCWDQLSKRVAQNSDIFCIQYADPEGMAVRHATDDQIECEVPFHLDKNKVWVIEDCQHRELITSPNFKLQYTYNKGAYLRKLYQVIYYVAPTGRVTASKDPINALYRLDLSRIHQPQEHVEHIDQMKVLYGLFNGKTLNYVKAEAVTDWSEVRNITVQLYMRSSQRVIKAHPNPQLEFLKKDFQQTTMLRALQSI